MNRRRTLSPVCCPLWLQSAPNVFQKLTPFYLLAAGLFAGPLVSAQSPAEPDTAQASEEATNGKQISSHIAAAVRATMPAYVAPATKAPEPASPEPVVPETNDPVVLEKLTIFGTKAHDFSERELATKSGLSDLLFKLYPGASLRGQDPGFMGKTHNYAALMFADDVRLENIANLTRTADDLKATGNLKLSKELRKEISRTFLRRTDWRTESMDRSANGNRR